MMQRAENVWLLYDSRSEGLKSGEESRYIKQLEYQYKYPLRRTVIRSGVGIPEPKTCIDKTEDDLVRIRQMQYSASSLRNYLDCPARFYYSSIRRLKAETEVTESLNGGMIGTVFHDTMYALYTGGEALAPDFDMDRRNVMRKVRSPLKEVTSAYVRRLVENRDTVIRPKIRHLIKRELKSDEVTGRNLVLEKVINQYVIRTLDRDLKLMEEHGSGRFEILGLEMECSWEFDGYRFTGYVDRMDRFVPGMVRIVDYKTGRVGDNDVSIDDSNADKVAADLFAPVSPNRPEIALQLFLYDMFVRDRIKGDAIENVIYPVPQMFRADIMSSPECAKFNGLVTERLKALFAELADPDAGFRLTEDQSVCRYCDFRKICGRQPHGKH